MPSNFIKNSLSINDTFAIWDETELLAKYSRTELDEMSQPDRNIAFRETYQVGFPKDVKKKFMQRSDDAWKIAMQQVKYVIVGLNAGNAGIPEQFANFHGQKKSHDANIAALLWNTPLKGAFMTDIDAHFESDSGKIKLSVHDTDKLYAHLANLGIPNDAILLAFSSKVANVLGSKYATKTKNHPFDKTTQKFYHYSYNSHVKGTAETESKKSRRKIEALYK